VTTNYGAIISPPDEKCGSLLRLWFLTLSFFCSNFLFAQTVPGKDYLDVSISVFDMNLPTDRERQSELDIYPEVRKTEVRYIPAFLQRRLMDSNLWGAVRLLPSDDPGAELLIKGKIISSDGTRLDLEISATDSTGRSWINKIYNGKAVVSVSAKQSIEGTEPFLYLYDEIAQDLAEVYDKLSIMEINKIKAVSQLRYAAFLSPETFTSYLNKSEDGLYEVNHMPADNDPNYLRIQKIRQHEFLFIDVVNEQYQTFFVNVKPVYDLWRKYRREQQASDAYLLAREADGGNKYSRGSYMALREAYNNFRLANMKDQYLNEISKRFNNEIKSTDIKLEDSLFHLTGALDEQYSQWRSILKDIYKLEK